MKLQNYFRTSFITRHQSTVLTRVLFRQNLFSIPQMGRFVRYVFVGWLSVFCLAQSATAQQNLFNIPSGEITRPGKVFYQHQLNVHQPYLESKGHFVYGLGNGWEVGANIVGKGFFFTREWREAYGAENPGEPRFYPMLMGTVQKGFALSEKFDFNLGLQAGANLSGRLRGREPAVFAYGLGVWHFAKGSRIVGGAYQSNQIFLGTGNSRGVLLGYEYKLSKRWYLMGDWISGRNDAGAAVIGGMFVAGPRTQVCAGWLLPNPRTPKPMGLVLELNLLGWDYDN